MGRRRFFSLSLSCDYKKVGDAHYRCHPQNRLKQIVPSVQGDIYFEIKRDNNNIVINLSSPANTTAVVGVPKQYYAIDEIRFNNELQWRNGKAITSHSDISYLDEDDKYIKFEVSPGNWSIEASK